MVIEPEKSAVREGGPAGAVVLKERPVLDSFLACVSEPIARNTDYGGARFSLTDSSRTSREIRERMQKAILVPGDRDLPDFSRWSYIGLSESDALSWTVRQSYDLARKEGRYFGRDREEVQKRFGGDRAAAVDALIQFLGRFEIFPRNLDILDDRGKIRPGHADTLFQQLFLERGTIGAHFAHMNWAEFLLRRSEPLLEMQARYEHASSHEERSVTLTQMTARLRDLNTFLEARFT